MQASTELNKEVSEMKKRFFANLFSEDSKYNSVLLTKRKYDSIIEDVKRIKVAKKKESSRDYRIIQRYDVLTVQGCERLIEPLSDTRESVKEFVHAEELFDILYSTHLSIGHGGRDRMIKQLNTFYKNITQAQIKMFLDLCESCQHKQKSVKKGIVVHRSAPLIEDTAMKNIQLPCTFKESPLHVKDVITELPSTSAESPSQFHAEPAERTIKNMVCIVCSKAVSGAYKCIWCHMFVHVICGEIDPKEGGYGKNVLCNICKKSMDQEIQRDEAKKDVEKRAKKMLAVSNAKHTNVDEGVTVRINVPEVDRAKTDELLILAVVLSKTEDGFYKLGTKAGILKQLYAESEFSVCEERLLTKEDVPAVEISLCQTTVKQSLGTGQGSRKCDCKSKCTTNRCACRKNQLLCNSKCHQSLDCTNK